MLFLVYINLFEKYVLKCYKVKTLLKNDLVLFRSLRFTILTQPKVTQVIF